MQKLLYTEFFKWAKNSFSHNVIEIVKIDTIINTLNDKVDVCDSKIIIDVLIVLAKNDDVIFQKLLNLFVKYFVGIIYERYPYFFDDIDNVFIFMFNVDGYMNSELLNVYPELSKPRLDFKLEGKTFFIFYNSSQFFFELVDAIILEISFLFGDNVITNKSVLSEHSISYHISNCFGCVS